MSNLEMYSLLVGFLLPPVLAALMRTGWSAQLKSVVAFIACVIAGAGTAYFQGTLSAERWVEAALVILVAGQATYHGFWKPSGVAPKIDKATG